MSTSRNLVIAGPSSILDSQSTSTSSSGETTRRMLLLPHPRTRVATYYLPHVSGRDDPSASSADADGDGDATDQLLELQIVRPDNAKRSWFLGQRGVHGAAAAGSVKDDNIGEGLVINDGALHILTPIDPILVLLPLLSVILSSNPVPFLPASDLFERAAATLYEERARAFNTSLAPKGSTTATGNKGKTIATAADSLHEKVDETGVWEDIVRFGRTDVAMRGLKSVCTTQALDEHTLLHRPDENLILNHLAALHERLCARQNFEKLPLTLGRQLGREFEAWDPSFGAQGGVGKEAEEMDERTRLVLQKEEQEARAKIAREIIVELLPLEWVDRLDKRLAEGEKGK